MLYILVMIYSETSVKHWLVFCCAETCMWWYNTQFKHVRWSAHVQVKLDNTSWKWYILLILYSTYYIIYNVKFTLKSQTMWPEWIYAEVCKLLWFRTLNRIAPMIKCFHPEYTIFHTVCSLSVCISTWTFHNHRWRLCCHCQSALQIQIQLI